MLTHLITQCKRFQTNEVAHEMENVLITSPEVP